MGVLWYAFCVAVTSLASFTLGAHFAATEVENRIKRGRVEVDGTVYWCLCAGAVRIEEGKKE